MLPLSAVGPRGLTPTALYLTAVAAVSPSTLVACTKQSVAVSVASLLGVDLKPLAAFASHGGTVTFWQSSGSAAHAGSGPAQLGLPMTSEGVPDFAAIVAAGGKVTGGLQYDGAVMNTIVSDAGVETIYAAQIDRGDGSPPVFIKSVGMTAAPGDTPIFREQQLQDMASYFAALPNSLDEARAQCPNGLLDWVSTTNATQRQLDISS